MRIRLQQLVLVTTLFAALQSSASAQNNAGYYQGFLSKNPIDIRMSALYDRIDSMYNAGFFAPQERAELLRDLDGLQCYEMRARVNPYGMSKWAAQQLNRQLDVFTAQLDVRGST
jgi:hypothetical protein